MNNDKRILAYVSLGLLVATPLVPFFLAALGRYDLALGFGGVAGLLALLFGALSWKEYIGRTVIVALPAIVVVGLVIVLTIRAQRLRDEETAEVVQPPVPLGGTPAR